MQSANNEQNNRHFIDKIGLSTAFANTRAIMVYYVLKLVSTIAKANSTTIRDLLKLKFNRTRHYIQFQQQ